MDETAIQVEHVSKNFLLPHEKVSSLKNLFTHAYSYIRKRRTYEIQHALKDVTFEVKKGEFFGIVGRNGSGKSTLLKILAGIYQPNQGEVIVDGKLVPFIELGVGFNPELTGRENVYLNGALLGFAEDEVKKMYKDIVDFAELEAFMDQKLKNYSSGMQVRLAFSMAVRAQADILLIDEVLAVGDADFKRKCYDHFNYLKKTAVTVVFVSHDMGAVREYCDRAALIEKNQIVEIGKARTIANRYDELFMEDKPIATPEGETQTNRWGDGSARTGDIAVQVSPDTITISGEITSYKDIDGLVAGFGIKNTKGELVTGSNTTLEQQKIGKLAEGQHLRLTWTLPNIFSDGSYYIELTIHNRSTTAVYDWWEEAAKFAVRKPRKLPYYAVDPGFKVVIDEG